MLHSTTPHFGLCPKIFNVKPKVVSGKHAECGGAMVKEEEETATVLQRTCVIIKKLLDENAMLRIERNMLVEESMDAAKQRIKDMKLMKEIIARCEN